MRNVKKLVLSIIVIGIAITTAYAQTIIACPGSGIECKVTVTNADGSSITVESQKDPEAAALTSEK